MSYDTWKTTQPPDEDYALCSKCKAGPCECCQDCGAAPDVKCDANCPDQLRCDVFDREQRISTLELEVGQQSQQIESLTLRERELVEALMATSLRLKELHHHEEFCSCPARDCGTAQVIAKAQAALRDSGEGK